MPVDPVYRASNSIPIPHAGRGGGGIAKYPWHVLNTLNGSFFVETTGKTKSQIGSLQSTLMGGVRIRKFKAVSRQVVEDGTPGVRVWRVS